jgi:FkbM family methyltransferase
MSRGVCAMHLESGTSYKFGSAYVVRCEMTGSKSSFKLIAKALLQRLGHKLPPGVKQALLDGIVGSLNQFEGFQCMGRALAVESISVRGKNGLVWGSLEDRWLLGSYALRGEWSPETIELFQEFFRLSDGGSYLDIGANTGLTLFPIAQNPMVQCYGFEPEPRNFAYLNLGLRENCAHQNVVVNQIALFDRKSKIKFELSEGNSGDHKIQMAETNGLHGGLAQRTIFVNAERLDDVLDLSRLKRPIVIKIDTQGAEPNIFAGGAETIAAAELLALEFAPSLIRRMGGDVEAEFSILETHFREGHISMGDAEGSPINWRPIAAIVGEMRGAWEDPDIGVNYFDIVVRT